METKNSGWGTGTNYQDLLVVRLPKKIHDADTDINKYCKISLIWRDWDWVIERLVIAKLLETTHTFFKQLILI